MIRAALISIFRRRQALSRLREEELLAEQLYELWRKEYCADGGQQASWSDLVRFDGPAHIQGERNGWLAVARWVLGRRG